MNPDSRDFDISDVLSITTGCLVSTRHIDGVYDILNFMTGESLFTHALPRASRICGPVLLQQHPQLAAVDASGVDTTNWQAWLAAQRQAFGDTFTVQPLSSGEYESKNPLTELAEMMESRS